MPAPPLPPAPRHRYSCPLRWADLDAQGHLNNASYLDVLQEARVDFLLAGPSGLGQLLDTGVLVVAHQVEYLRPVTFRRQPLTVELWVDALGGSRFVVGYDVRDDGRLAARARTTAVPYDLGTAALRRLSTDERAALGGYLAPADPLPALPRVPVGESPHRYPLTVRWSDLDAYGHVNNVKFFDYVQEARIALLHDTVGWADDDVWLVVRQDLEYRRPLDFRATPYEVVSAVTEVGNRSFRVSAEIRDPVAGTVYATARTVVVAAAPLTGERREALAGRRAA